MFGQSPLIHRVFKQLAKALIRLHVCADWSEPLLVAHTTFLEISCLGSFLTEIVIQVKCELTFGSNISSQYYKFNKHVQIK